MCAELWSGVQPSTVTNDADANEPKQQRGAGVLFRHLGEEERQGKAMEAAEKIINQAFDLLIDAISTTGGDIVRIAGDAIIVTFRADKAERESTLSEGGRKSLS